RLSLARYEPVCEPCGGAASVWQVDEQPSPLVVLPSSHCSPAWFTTPSPQIGGGGGGGGCTLPSAVPIRLSSATAVAPASKHIAKRREISRVSLAVVCST